MNQPLKVTARLGSPIVFAEPLMLDGLLEYRSCHLNQIGGGLLTRSDPAPVYGEVPIPLLRKQFGGLLVPCCSSPVFLTDHQWHEHVCKRFPTEFSELLQRDKLTKLNTTGGRYKSFRLPLHCRSVEQLVWFCWGHRRPLLKMLRGIPSLGKKRSDGYGRVTEWSVAAVEQDYSWFAPRGNDLLLMRPLPACDALPGNLTGYRADFGAVQSPYWHPSRFCERVVPC